MKCLKLLVTMCSSLVLFNHSNYCYSMEERNMSYDEEEKNNSFINNEENNNPESNNINSMNNIDTINNINHINNIIEENSEEEKKNNSIISNEGENNINEINEDNNIPQYDPENTISKYEYNYYIKQLENLMQELVILLKYNLYDDNIFFSSNIIWCQQLQDKLDDDIIPNINAIIKFDTKDYLVLPYANIDKNKLKSAFASDNDYSHEEIYMDLKQMINQLLVFNSRYYKLCNKILEPRYSQHLLKLAIVLNDMKEAIKSIFNFENETLFADPTKTKFYDIINPFSYGLAVEQVNNLNFGRNRIKRSNSMNTRLPSKYDLNKEAIKQEPINDFQIEEMKEEKLLPKHEIDFTIEKENQDNNG